MCFLSVPVWENENNKDLEVVEMFAGVARIAKLSSWVGYRSRAVDLLYHPPKNPTKPKRGKYPRACMDINGAAGFVNLVIDRNKINCNECSCILIAESWNIPD